MRRLMTGLITIGALASLTYTASSKPMVTNLSGRTSKAKLQQICDGVGGTFGTTGTGSYYCTGKGGNTVECLNGRCRSS